MKILKFGAVWCPGCLVMRKIMKEIEEGNPNLKTEYYDYDNDTEMVEKYNIAEKLPAFIFIDKDGKEFLRLEGEISKKKMLEAIEKSKQK